ncbi:MAG: hypothetical protein MUP70_14350 [Candidatus Aminicenantes bacterium]|nr:hypothetical protein [Candidatus Aminicenantes bacterium]
MKNNSLIPPKKEVLFIFKLIMIFITGSALALLVLYLVLNKNIGDSYSGAVKTITVVTQRINLYILAAIGIQLVFSSILVFIVTLLYSHKIAGPVFRLKAVMQRYSEGELPDSFAFRKTDFLSSVPEWFNDYFVNVRQRNAQIETAEQLTREYIKGGGKDKEQRIKIENIIGKIE